MDFYDIICFYVCILPHSATHRLCLYSDFSHTHTNKALWCLEMVMPHCLFFAERNGIIGSFDFNIAIPFTLI